MRLFILNISISILLGLNGLLVSSKALAIDRADVLWVTDTNKTSGANNTRFFKLRTDIKFDKSLKSLWTLIKKIAYLGELELDSPKLALASNKYYMAALNNIMAYLKNLPLSNYLPGNLFAEVAAFDIQAATIQQKQQLLQKIVSWKHIATEIPFSQVQSELAMDSIKILKVQGGIIAKSLKALRGKLPSGRAALVLLGLGLSTSAFSSTPEGVHSPLDMQVTMHPSTSANFH